jgi:hypothetical protein
MTFAVVVLQHTLLSGRSPWLRLMLEIGGGAAGYIATVTLLHRERVTYFLSVAKRLRGPKLRAEGVAGS